MCRVLESEKKNRNHGARTNARMRTQIHTLARARAYVGVVDERAHLLNFVRERESVRERAQKRGQRDRQTDRQTDRERESDTQRYFTSRC